jgi:hypothetical protein
VFRAQLAATRPIEDRDIDLLLWPEGGIDADPLSNTSVRTALDALADRVGAPLLVSGVTQRGDQYFNSSLLWKAGVRTRRRCTTSATRFRSASTCRTVGSTACSPRISSASSSASTRRGRRRRCST